MFKFQTDYIVATYVMCTERVGKTLYVHFHGRADNDALEYEYDTNEEADEAQEEFMKLWKSAMSLT